MEAPGDMDFSKLSSSEKMTALAAAVVVVSGLISIVNDWGTLMFIGVLAGVAALVVVFGPQIMPGTRMPGSNGSLLTVIGAVAVLIWAVVFIDNLGWVADHIVNLDTLQFVIGFIAAVGIAWYGWQTLQSEGGQMRFGMSSGPRPATSAAPAAPAAPAAQAAPPASATPAAPPVAPPVDEPPATMEDEDTTFSNS